MSPVSILIITHNEEINLPGCLASIGAWCSDVWIVDSFSTDGTLRVASSAGANVVQHAWEGYAAQKNWALVSLAMRHEWVLILDADERLTPELKEEIDARLTGDPAAYDGYYINRKFIFYGKWIKHCGWYPSWNLRLFRRALGRYEDRLVDEHLLLEGRAGYLRNDMLHEDLRDLEFWIAKHNRYSTFNAQVFHAVKNGSQSDTITPRFWGTQAERKRFLKEKIYRRLPGRSFIFFLYMYVFRLGFLDGSIGLRFCTMHAIFQYFNAAKLWELESFKSGAVDGAIRLPKSPDSDRKGHSA